MSHYYKDHKPFYEIESKNGKGLRPVTIRDARKLKLQPGVTEVTSIVDKPGLLKYRLEQIIIATNAEDRQREEENFRDYAKRLIDASRQKSKLAALAGSTLHDKLDKYFKDPVNVIKDWDLNTQSFLCPVISEVKSIFDGKWIAEKSFSHPLGFGGKVDLSTEGYVIDFKTKESINAYDYYAYNEHLMQLAAYREGLKIPTAKCFDIYFSHTKPGIIKVHEWAEPELQSGWRQFKSLLEYWKEVHQYDSSFVEEETHE